MDYYELIDDDYLNQDQPNKQENICRPGDDKDPRRGHISRHNKKYSEKKAWFIKAFYILGIIIWLIIIFLTRIYQSTDLLGIIILSVPLIVFLISISNADGITVDIEDSVFQANYLAVGLLIVIPLLTWVAKDFQGPDKQHFVTVLVLAIILTMLSLLDIWVKRGWISVAKHVKSELQTMSLVLIIYAFYLYYTGSYNGNLFS